MGLFDRLLRRAEATPELSRAGDGVLPLLFGAAPDLESQLDEDVATYREAGVEVIPSKASSVAELRELIASRNPQVLHLLASFTGRGSLVDASGGELYLRELLSLSEESGVRLFIIASQNDFEHVKTQAAKSKVMNFLTIVHRNRHFASFLRGIIAGLAKNQNFALAYVELAPQHESVQRGRPLPGSIAICPGKRGEKLFLWSEAQP